MLETIRKYYFYFILINITFSANDWTILGLLIGQLIYWFLLFCAVAVLSQSEYFITGIFLIFLTLVLKMCHAFLHIPFTGNLGEVTSGIVFILVGSVLYGRNPRIIYKQLLYFFSLSIPFMLMQKIGAHVFFYGWSTEIFHDNGTYSFDGIKDKGVLLKNIPLYPTLFIDFNNLTYVIYQGRPTGLLYSNNVLSVLISFGLALYFSINHNNKLSLKFISISLIIVLTSSTLVYSILILLFIYFYFFQRDTIFKLNAFKLLCFTFIMLSLHYIFFPGVTAASLGLVNITSFVYRFSEIFGALGLDYFDELIVLKNIKIDSESEESFSLVGSIFKSGYAYLFFSFIVIFTVLYYFRLKQNIQHSLVYVVLFIVCVLTQFAINYLRAPSFQLFLGIALFPLLQTKVFKRISTC